MEGIAGRGVLPCASASFGPNASVTGVGTATSGTVEIVNGEVKYTPNEDFNGSDTFTYTVTTAGVHWIESFVAAAGGVHGAVLSQLEELSPVGLRLALYTTASRKKSPRGPLTKRSGAPSAP